jgi:serine/threonine protein kinase
MAVPRFDVTRILGTGAQGVVVLARDHEDVSQEPLALKVLKRVANADPAALSQLRDEAKVLAWLSHRNIVQVHRLLEKNGCPIVVMEYVEGASTVEQLVRNGDGLPPSAAVEIARRATIALTAAYERPGPDGEPMRIVHRDIKPANLLVSVDGAVKVVDFGIATGAWQNLGAKATDAGVVGTRGYIAPERWDGVETPAVDVYSLGVTLFVMLTGKVLGQTMSPDQHDASVEKFLTYLSPRGLDAAGVHALRDLVGGMIRYEADERPSLAELQDRLFATLMVLGPPDMAEYADSFVKPIVASRQAVDPRLHPAWAEVSFLLEPGFVADEAVVTPGPPRPLALRKVEGPPDIEPLLRIISPRRWWAVLDRPPTNAQLVDALHALCGSRDERVVERAHELTKHANPDVAEAAWDVLAAAC